jgi:hypothetical protein
MSSPPFARRPARGFTPELLEHTRQRYEQTDETQASIALDLGMSRSGLEKLARKQGWALRKDRMMRDLPESLRLNLVAVQAVGAAAGGEVPVEQSPAETSSESVLSPNIAARLEQAVEKELRKVEAQRSEFGPVSLRTLEAERTARTLATLTETLFKVRRLREPNPIGVNADDDMPADIAGFRHALAQRMDAFVRSRADGAVPAEAEPPRAAAPPP